MFIRRQRQDASKQLQKIFQEEGEQIEEKQMNSFQKDKRMILQSNVCYLSPNLRKIQMRVEIDNNQQQKIIKVDAINTNKTIGNIQFHKESFLNIENLRKINQKQNQNTTNKIERIIRVYYRSDYVDKKIKMNFANILQFNNKLLTDMKHYRDSVSPEVRQFIKQFYNCQKDQKQDKQTSTEESSSSIIDERQDEINIKEVFLKLPNEEVQENRQPYLKISKTPIVYSNNNSLSSIDQDRYVDVIVQKVVEEMERRNNSKRQPMLSIQQNTVQVKIAPKSELDYLDDDSFIRHIQQTLLNPHHTPKKLHNFENFEQRQKQFQIQREQKLQKQREAQQLTKLVDEFKCYLIRTRKTGGL